MRRTTLGGQDRSGVRIPGIRQDCSTGYTYYGLRSKDVSPVDYLRTRSVIMGGALTRHTLFSLSGILSPFHAAHSRAAFLFASPHFRLLRLVPGRANLNRTRASMAGAAAQLDA